MCRDDEKMDNSEKKLKALGIGRFQVMALLQAARHYLIHKDLERAKSFGLNRAIFYAWAKYYGSRIPRRLLRVQELVRKGIAPSKELKCPEGYVEELGECVKVSPRGYYVMGEEEQTPYDYDRQVTRKLKLVIDPEKAWKTALEYVSMFPREILMDPAKFYKYVYEPVRDTFIKQLLEDKPVEPPKTLLEELGKRGKRAEKQKSILDFYGADGR